MVKLVKYFRFSMPVSGQRMHVQTSKILIYLTGNKINFNMNNLLMRQLISQMDFSVPF